MLIHRAFTMLVLVVSLSALAGLALAAKAPKDKAKSQPAAEQKTAVKAEVATTEKPAVTPAKPGDPAPDFALTDLDGNVWKLADLTANGKIVVLEWFSPGCPACVAYYKPGEDGSPAPMERIMHSIAGDDVIWLAVNSADPARDGNPEQNVEAQATWPVAPPILLDPTGEVGKAYGAQRTPHIAIIAANGTYAYRGAPEERATEEGVEGMQFVTRTVSELRNGKRLPTILETLAFG